MISFNYNGDAPVVYARTASELLAKDYWYLKEELKIDIYINDDFYELTVPEGYLTDGASVPRILWSIYPKWDKTHYAVILHDYLCEYGVIKKNGVIENINRLEVDNLFLCALRFDNISKVKYTMMYAAIRAHANAFNLTTPRVNTLKLQFEDEIRLNLKERYYK